MFEFQHTIKEAVEVDGVSLHTGEKTTLRFKPAPANHGIRFQRTDLPEQPVVRALVENVQDTKRGTTIGENGATVQTVEHVLSAVSGLGIDNLLIEIDGGEPPVFDGSARDYTATLKKAGIEKLSAKRDVFTPEAPVFFRANGSSLVILPSDQFEISCTISFRNQVLDSQFLNIKIDPESFEKEIAPARTFCFYEEVKPLIDSGLIKGGSLECAVLIKGDEIHSKEALRFRDEFVRHKILDILGDVTLLGRPVRGHIMAVCPGHTVNAGFTKKLRDILQRRRGAKKYSAEGASYEQMDIVELLETLPHRYPFVLVDRILKLEAQHIIGLKNVTINEPFFQGHFPGHPVMPGVLQLEAMAQTAGILMLKAGENVGKIAYFMSADKVKFRKPVQPGDQLIIEVELTKSRGNRLAKAQCRILVDNEIASEAELMFSIVDRDKGA